MRYNMNANTKLNEFLKEMSSKKPAWHNDGNLNTVKFPSIHQKEKHLTDADLGLNPTKKNSKTTENREA